MESDDAPIADQAPITDKVQIEFKDATKAQLRKFAKEVLGLPVSPNPAMAAEKIVAQIKAAWPHDYIELTPEEAAAAVDMPAPKTVKTATPKGVDKDDPEKKVYWIYVDRQEGAQGDQHVELSCNGRAILVPRGMAAPLSYGHYNALYDAVSEIYDPLKEGGISTEPRRVPRYPWRAATQTEIETFRRKNANHPLAKAVQAALSA